MRQDKELQSLMRAIAEKSLELLGDYKNQPNQLPILIEKYLEFCKNFQEIINTLLKNPESLLQMQQTYLQDVAILFEEQCQYWLQGKSMPIDDARFASEIWVGNPFFNLLTQHYLLASKHIQSLLENMHYEDTQSMKRVRFFCKQYLDALSPANFLMTNPELIAETLESHGKNLLQGMENFLKDYQRSEALGAGHFISTTDTQAFSLGKNLATTAGQVVYRNDIMELVQYSPTTKQVYEIPLLVIPPWINKYYILDLSSHNSFMGYLVNEGFTVFMISWVNPDAALRDKGLFDYLHEGPITAINIIKKQLQVKKVNTLGFCIGGTLQACLLAYNTAKRDNSIQSATFLASLIDFSDPGDISVFIDELQIKHIEEQMHLKGYLDGRFMASTFNSLRANDLIWSFFIKNYLRGQTPIPFDILYWNSDATNLPRKIHSQYLRFMYLHNDLIKPNKINLNNTGLDLSKVTTATFFVSTIKDHIAPWKTTFLGFQLLQGKKQFLLAGSGHIAGIVNPPEAKKYEYYTNTSQRNQSAEAWLAKAKVQAGSWWPYWVSWLQKQSGKMQDAPYFDSLPFQPLMPAPGQYVKSSILK